MLIRCASRDALSPFQSQITFGIAKAIEGIMGRDGKRKRSEAAKCLSFVWNDQCSSGLSSREVGPIIFLYIQNSACMFFDVIYYSISTDKAFVSGIPLQNTIIVAGENNFGVLAPPAVVVMFL